MTAIASITHDSDSDGTHISKESTGSSVSSNDTVLGNSDKSFHNTNNNHQPATKEVCAICKRSYANKNSLNAHRSRFHRPNIPVSRYSDSESTHVSKESTGSSENSKDSELEESDTSFDKSNESKRKNADKQLHSTSGLRKKPCWPQKRRQKSLLIPSERGRSLKKRKLINTSMTESDDHLPKNRKLSLVKISKIHDLLMNQFKEKKLDYSIVWLLQTHAIPSLSTMFKNKEDMIERAGVNAEFFVSIARDMTTEQLTKLEILHKIANTHEFEESAFNIAKIWCKNNSSAEV